MFTGSHSETREGKLDSDDSISMASVSTSPASRRASPFSIQSSDVITNFDWSSSLKKVVLSRQAIATQLDDSYQRCVAQGTSELTLITGPAGVGKTSLAVALRNQVAADNGFLIQGKFDQLETSLQTAATTYCLSAFTDAFTQYIDSVVKAGEESTQLVKTALESQMNTIELQVLQETVPAIERIVGPKSIPTSKRPSVGWATSTLKGADAEDRLIRILSIFMRTIASLGKPIILFLDDLQWANRSALNLMTSIAVSCCEEQISSTQHASPHIMLLCTCRVNEVSEDHPLTSMLQDLRDQNVHITQIPVSNLSQNEVNIVIVDLLQTTAGPNTDALSEYLYQRTEGNLLFIIEILKSLYADNNLNRGDNGVWTWNMNDILSVAGTGTLNELIAESFHKLDSAVQLLLKIASCMGSSFSLRALAYAGGLQEDEVYGLLVPLRESIGLIAVDDKTGIGRFSHDKVQHTIYSLTPESKLDEFHLYIGQKLRKNMPRDLLSEHTLLVSHHISHGIHLLDDPVEKLDVADLFLQASQIAAQCSSFTTAAAFVHLAIRLLGQRPWKDQYKRTLSMFNFAAELDYYNGNLQRVDELVESVIQHAQTFDDSLVARFTKIYSLGSRGNMQQGLSESLNVLISLGEKLPRKPGMLHVVIGFIRCKRMLHGKSDQDILNLPRLRDIRKQTAMRLLIISTIFAFYESGEHLTLIAFRLIENTLKHGMSGMACLGFACLGMVEGLQGNADEAYRYANLALKIFEKFESTEWQARLGVLVYGFVFPLKHPFRDVMDPLRAAHRSSLVLGDIHSSMLCDAVYYSMCYFAGFPLSRAVKEARRSIELCVKFGQMSVKSNLDLSLQLALNLMGKSSDPLILTGEACNEDEAIQQAKVNDPVGYIYWHFMKLQLAVYMGDVAAAKPLLRQLRKLDLKKLLPFLIALLAYFEGLAYAMSSDGRSRKRSKQRLAKLKAFAKHAPCNYLNKVYLIEAELAAQASKFDDAEVSFNLAIQLARDENLVHDQALACERAACAFEKNNRSREARQYLMNAKSLYGEWGAQVKEDQLNLILR